MVRETLHLSTILPTVMKRHFHMHLVSDSTGETLQTAARAAMASYTDHSPIPHIHALIRTPRQLARTVADIESQPGIVFFTLLDPEIRRQLEEQCQQIGVPAVSILDSMIQSLGVFLNSKSRPQVGGQYVLNADYFRRMDALAYTLAHDDGQNADDLSGADIILLGISRSSKTPTSIYLALRGLKIANVPIVKSSPLPKGLHDVKDHLVIGLMASAERIAQIRKHRLISLNEKANTSYIDARAIQEEILNMTTLCRKHDWPLIDVTRRSVEETAATITKLHAEWQADHHAG